MDITAPARQDIDTKVRQGLDAPARHGFDATAVADWLVHEAGRIATIDDLVDGFASALVAAGLPVDRLTIGVPTLLPHIAGMQLRWYAGAGTDRREFPATADTLRQMEASPVRAAYRDGAATRCRIARGEAAAYPIVEDLRGEGFTDYLVLPIPFSDGTFKALSVATLRPDGFSDDDLEALAGIMAHLAPVIEVRALRHLARRLLDVYVGPTASRRVLDGAIRRGEGEQIQAVICFCDLRRSTDLAISLEGSALVRLLNSFFGIMTDAIAENGGEVLKFIGDAVLAIFPCSDLTGRTCDAAGRAELAARDAISRIVGVNRRAREAGEPAIDIAIALHVGNVFFGNVGGEDRLDFTVIGPAVNLASRIQALSPETGESLLVSEDFARTSMVAYEPIGAFRFKGIEGWSMVYAPAREVAGQEA